MKYINGEYKVTDCECNGDLFRESDYLRSIGCDICETYWDGIDCGEAYIRFKIKENDFPRIYRTIHSTTSFDADINDYIKQKFELDGFPQLKHDELISISRKLSNNFNYGFEKMIPIYLFFDERKNVDSKSVINEILSNFNEYKPIGCNKLISDGTTYISLLFTIDFNELQYDTFSKIGDSCFSAIKCIIKNHGLYGKCCPTHKTFELCRDYETTRILIQRIMNKDNITYKRKSFLNDNKTIEADYSKYMIDGKFQEEIKDSKGNKYEFDRYSIK